MPLTLTSNIEAEVEAAHLSVIDLIEVDLGKGFKKFWSTREVPFEYVSADFPQKFEARILSMGDRTWSLGADDDSLTLVLDNSDEGISNISKEYGIEVFEGARVNHHRLFPGIKETYQNYWAGSGLPMSWSHGIAEWEINFGIGNIKKKFGRLQEFNCPHMFAGGTHSDCPYDLEQGKGVPDIATSGIVTITATASTSATVIHASGGGLSAAKVGWYVYSQTNNVYARITGVTSNIRLEIDTVATGEGGGAFATGNKLLIGPPFLICPGKNPSDCREREMWGKHSGNTTGAGDKRRYFGGDSEASKVSYSGNLPEQRQFGGKGDRFTRTSLGNESLADIVVPVIVGFYRVKDIASAYHAPSGRFQHGMFNVCEGEISQLRPVIGGVNGFDPDTNRPVDFSDETNVIQNDAFITWGVWWKNNTTVGVEDDRATTVELAKQIRQAIGRRRSVGIQSNYTIIDTYGNGTAGNPYLFNTANGDGTSQHGLAAARIRIDTDQDNKSALTADFDVHGLLVPLPTGMSNNKRDRVGHNLVVGATTLRYTANPNPIQVAYALLRNARWGAGLDDNQIDLASVITESDYCEERVESVESAGAVVYGTVDFASSDFTGNPSNDMIMCDDIFSVSGSLVDRTIFINYGTDKAHVAKVLENTFNVVYFEDENAVYSGDRQKDPDIDFDRSGNTIRFTPEIPSGNEPSNGDLVKVVGGQFVRRFSANGVMADHVPIPDMLEDVLANCNGTFRSNGSKIEFLIRKELSAAEIATVIADGIFTDRGVKRNIINHNGKSTLSVWREDETSIGNYFTAAFRDNSRDFQESRVAVHNDAAQRRAADLFGDTEGREKIPEDMRLMLTTSKDQAARLLSLNAREQFIQNIFCRFETSLKRGMKARPGDIIAIDSEIITNHFSKGAVHSQIAIGDTFLFRVLSKTETSAYTIQLECQVHVNPIYQQFAPDFAQYFGPDITQRTRKVMAANVAPLAATETVVIGADHSARSRINVKITWPNLDRHS